MIVRSDILDITDPEPALEAWARGMRDVAYHQPGFAGAALYHVYKKINRQGYTLISIARWESLAAYYDGDFHRLLLPFTEMSGGVGPKLYGCVDRSVPSPLPIEKGHLVITNPYRIAATAVGENVRMWNATKRMMENQEGFLDAELFHSFDPAADDYRLISRARWLTESAFLKPFGDRDYKTLVAPFEGTFQICFSNVVDQVIGNTA